MIAVIPMAGRGRRFAEIGIHTPKPLINVKGKPMYAWAMSSLPLKLLRKVVFICLNEHLEERRLRDDILSRFGFLEPIIMGLDDVTEGQACTVLTARGLINTEESLLIYNSDTFCHTNLAEIIPTLAPNITGLLGVFKTIGNSWSFAKVDKVGRVLETAEKRRISDWACTGLYYFKCGSDFVTYAEQMIAANERVNHEFYVAPVYNRMIADGANIWINEAKDVWPLGTPEDLNIFEQYFSI
jgi:NDP-sugar pyrophosphorylase family protein